MFKCCKSNAAIPEPNPYNEKAAPILDDAPTEADEPKTLAEEEPKKDESPVEEEPISEKPKEESDIQEETDDRVLDTDEKTEADQTEAQAEDEAMTKGYKCCGVYWIPGSPTKYFDSVL